MFQVSRLTRQFEPEIQRTLDTKTKPLGALGKLERVAKQLTTIYSDKAGTLMTKPEIVNPSLIVFAGDHGIAQHGVSIAPSEVTGQMVANFAMGGAAINVLALYNDMASFEQASVIDVVSE